MAEKKKKSKSSSGKKPALKKPVAKKTEPKMMFYYYMLKEDVKASDLAVCAELPEEKTEVWTEMNLTELILANDSLVLEDAGEDFDSPDDLEFLKEKGIVCIYAVSYSELDEADAISILKKMVQKKGGAICSDTEDFQPLLCGEF